LFIISCGLTQFMSNTASAALLCPIGIAIAKQLGASPQAVLMAIAVAASCAFATPVGTPPNTLVLGPGSYKFMDYVKAGTGLVSSASSFPSSSSRWYGLSSLVSKNKYWLPLK
jgi:sodium-dependent dicarboxylate transporter 2/3/5